MRNVLDAFEGVIGAVLAWAIIAWAAHDLYQRGYDDGYQDRTDELPKLTPAAIATLAAPETPA